MLLASYGFALIVVYPDNSLTPFGWATQEDQLEPLRALAIADAMELWDIEDGELSARIVPATDLCVQPTETGHFVVAFAQRS